MTKQIATPAFPDERLTRVQAAEYLGLKPNTLAIDAMKRHLGVPFYHVGRKVFYRRSELDAWLTSHRVGADQAKGGSDAS